MRSSKSFKGDPMTLQQLRQEVRLVEESPAEAIRFGRGGREESRLSGTRFTFEHRGRRLGVFLPVGAPISRARRIAKDFFAGKGDSDER